jgi:hypothetical protein
MQVPARHVHIGGTLGKVKAHQLPLESWCMMRLDTRATARLEEDPQTFVMEGLNHQKSV